MRDVLYLAWRYLGYHRLKTAILVTSITLIAYLPVGLNVLVTQSADQLTARAQRTPLLVGAKGSPLELVLNSLYFESDPPAAASHAQVTRVAQSGLADPIPLYVRFRARGYPIVGTSLEYFDFRELRVAAGRPMAVLGECVLGATVAAELGLAPGGSVISSPESVFDLAGVYPLKMKVVGVLERSFDADDRAIFVDVKTAWVIEGLGPRSPGPVFRHGRRLGAVARRQPDRGQCRGRPVQRNHRREHRFVPLPRRSRGLPIDSCARSAP